MNKTMLPLILLSLVFVGCADPPKFHFNVVARKTAENGEPFSERKVQDIANVLTAFFGTPDKPAFPNAKSFHFPESYDYAEDFSKVVDFENLQWAAGPVASDENGRAQGLYREHCAHCHGITGDGAGPTALTLNPYPRDFRDGLFKFKSTMGKPRPTDDDLKRILDEGIPGTAMPSFKFAVTPEERDALVDYVKYLSIRGEIEKVLWDLTANLEKDGRLPLVFADGYDNLTEDEKDELYGWFEAEGIRIESIFKSWVKAKTSPRIYEPKEPPSSFDSSHEKYSEFVSQGRELFHGKSGACVQCHGDTGYGDGELGNYDTWNLWAKGKSDELIAEYVADGVLPPRTIQPRNFRNGVFRGGRRPIDLFYRIKNGIQGAQMPNAAILTDEQVWALVAYVREIRNETITGGQEVKPLNDKPVR